MTVAFIKFQAAPSRSVENVIEIITSAPGFEKVEQLNDKNTHKNLLVFLCRLQNGMFQEFKDFVTQHFLQDNLAVEEATKL